MDQPAADHPEGCTCDVCNCTPEDEFPHPEGCTCDVCKCTPPEEPTHPEGCTCDVCTCKPEESEPEPQPECICPDPCKCDEQEQTPPLGMKNCTCGDNCVCDRGDTAAAKTQADADAATMENAGTHPKECKCQECACAEGGDSEAGNCTCNPCACTECYYKNPTPVQTKECQCSNCTCVDCSDPSKQGDSNTCKCSECKCDPCAFNPQPAIKCKCGVCTCIECEGKDASTTTQPPAKEAKEEKKVVVAGPLPKDRSCHCIECYCDECSNAKKQGSKARPEIVIQISPVKKNVTTETTAGTGEIKCTCLNCICIECLNKEMGGDKQDAEVHSIDCKCPTCTCVSCADTDSKVKDAECHCSTCQCPECTSKSTEEHGENCKCPTCTCATCQDIPPATKDAECHCSTCKCPECSTKTAETHSIDCKCPTCTCAVCDDVPPLKKDAECHCSTCKCTECANKDGTLDPPPFEVPQKIDCECATCQCIICSSKAAGKDSASPTNDETFQIPERIPCACQKCTCPLCNTEGQGQNGGKQVAAQFQVPERLPCVCKNCTCCICKGKVGDKGQSGSEVVETFQVPERMPCDCKNCICIDCKGSPPTKDPQSGCNIENRPRGGGAFQPPTKMPCFCNTCQCVTCKFGMGSKMPTSALAGDIFEIPVRLPCQCSDPCKCIICNKNPVHDISAPTVTIKSSNIPATRPRSAPGGISTESCDCATLSSMCKCPECTAEKQRISAKVGSSTVRSNARVGVIQQTSFAGQVSKASFNKYSACVCVSCPDTSLKTETKDTSCIFSDSSACGKENVNLSTMDNATLAKKIASDARENCACKEQIKEIKSALTSIKSACTDAEKKAMKKPLIKQASDFNQTMSGLKLALTNLQEKCKAKDKMIYVMIGELRSRANSQTVMNVLNTCTGDAPDYDRAEDVKEKIGSNQLDSVSEEKQTFDEKIAKAVETERSSRKKKCKTCKCGKIHKNKNNKNVDLTGFEVVDIRKITHDSIIIKWKPPKSNLITGYDIFINGVNKSKVMSGGRTSAMIDSIDLSSTIQITIYAVTKCGRCEPPAIAIYEIVSQA